MKSHKGRKKHIVVELCFWLPMFKPSQHSTIPRWLHLIARLSASPLHQRHNHPEKNTLCWWVSKRRRENEKHNRFWGKDHSNSGKWRWLKAKKTGLVCSLLVMYHQSSLHVACTNGMEGLLYKKCLVTQTKLHSVFLALLCHSSVIGEQAVLFSWSKITWKRACLNLSLMWVMTVDNSRV